MPTTTNPARTVSKTGLIVLRMLNEDTGRAMCDSGGTPIYDENGKYVRSEHGYGRAFERDRGRRFETEPEIICKFDVRYQTLETWASVYWWLVNNFTYDEELTEEFNEVCAAPENEDEHYLPLAMEFLGTKEVIYTYNGECLLGRNVQIIGDYDGDRFLIQIHNGCDARGGLTKPVGFCSEEGGVPEVARASLVAYDPRVIPGQMPIEDWPTDSPIRWETENAGYTWLLDSDHRVELGHHKMTTDESKRGKGMIFVDPEGRGYCPLTGGLLVPHMW